MAKWTAFPHAGDYAFDATSLKKHWARLHTGDAEPLPKDTDVLKAWALFHSGDPKAALEAARRCLKLRRGHVAASLLIGAIHQLAGRQRQAERCFRQAVSLQGCSPQQAELARQHLAGFGKGRTAKR